MSDFGRNQTQAARILDRERAALATQADWVRVVVRSMIWEAEEDRQKFKAIIRADTRYQLPEAVQALNAECVHSIGNAEQHAAMPR